MSDTEQRVPAASHSKPKENKPQENKPQDDKPQKPVDYGAYQKRGL